MHQVVQLLGSLLVLAAFVLAQRGLLNPLSRAYLWLNCAGAFVLAIEAAKSRQWGFLLLESVWAIVSATGLTRRRSTGPPAHPDPAGGADSA